MIFRQKAMLRTAIRPKRKVVAGRTLRNGVARRGYRGVPVDDFRASFPLSGMTLSVVLGRTPWRAVRESYTDCREYMPLPPFVSPRPAEDVPAGCRSSGFDRRAKLSNCILADLRSAGSHCENSGSSDGTGASARSGCANQRSLLCPLSERGCRHPLLFAVLDLLVLLDQAKSTRKESVRKNFPINFSGIIPSQCLEDFLRGADLPPFGDKRWRQKCPQGEKVGERPTACA